MNMKKLSDKENAAFCTQLHVLISAGITPAEAISFMLDDSLQEEEQAILCQIKEQLFCGETLSSSLKTTGLFPEYMIDMIVLGEETGSLDQTLSSLASYYDQQHSITQSIKSSLIYPFIMTCTMFFMILVLLINVLPTINQVYHQLGTSVNGFSALLFTLSSFLQNISYVIYFAFFLIIGFFSFYYFRYKHTGIVPDIFYRLHLVQTISYQKACSQFASCLSLVTSSGIDLYAGLTIISKIIQNKDVKEKIALCLRYLQENGDYIHEALSKAEIFQPTAIRMLQIGYKAGNPDTVLKKISSDYEEQIQSHLNSLLNTVEPTLVIIFSVILGLILVSTLMPLIGIMANIG